MISEIRERSGVTLAKPRPVSAPAEQAAVPVVVIEPRTGWSLPDLRELWEYRELLYFLVWRDIKVRYKQTALGASWAVIQPFFTMVVFSLFFGQAGGVPSDGVPYPIFSFAALVPWTFFAHGLTQSAGSLVASQNLIKKVYFPRLAIPIATVLAGVVDFVIAFTVLIGMMAFYGIVPGAQVVWLPALLLLALVTALGVGLWFAALNVQYRDVAYVVPVHRTALALRDPGRLSEQHAPRALAHRLRAEPDGRRGGGVPMDAARHRGGPRVRCSPSQPWPPSPSSSAGSPLLPLDGAQLRGSGVGPSTAR
jgi:hypothetical protein